MLIVLEMMLALIGGLSALFSIAVTASPVTRGRGAMSRTHAAARATQDLASRETWLVSALHGIRVVTAWANGSPTAGEAPRAGRWERLLDGLMARQSV